MLQVVRIDPEENVRIDGGIFKQSESSNWKLGCERVLEIPGNFVARIARNSS